jgi:hypothetical protein
VPGKPEESLIYQRIVKGQMPPDKLAKDLAVELPTASETEKIRAWIAAGAPGPEAITVPPDALVKDSDRQFWSFQPPKRPAVPAVKNLALVRNPIDAFLLEKLEAKGLRYSREADRLALMRRAYLDVTGIPPPRRTSKHIAKINRRTLTKSWWTACSLHRATASAGGSTGSTWRATRTPKASGRTMACARRRGGIGTT